MSDGDSFDNIWIQIGKLIGMTDLETLMKNEIEKLGRVNILLSGRSGVGKTTLINAVFGDNVGKVGRGRPVTREITWYEVPDMPLRLCDTQGLELADFDKILADLKAEIKRCASGELKEWVHIAWICISESSERVEPGSNNWRVSLVSLTFLILLFLPRQLDRRTL